MKTRKLWIALCAALLCAALMCGMVAATADEEIILAPDATVAGAADDEIALEIEDGADLPVDALPDAALDDGALTLEANLAQAELETEEVFIDPMSNDGEAAAANPDAVPLQVTYSGPTLTKVYDCSKSIFKNIGTQDSPKYTYAITAPKAADFSVTPASGSAWVEGHKDVQINVNNVKSSQQFSSADVGSYNLVITFGLTGSDASYYAAQAVTIPATITPREIVITPRTGLTKVYGAKDPVYKADTWLSKDEASPLHQNIGGLPGYAVPLNTVDGKSKLTITNAAYILKEAELKGTAFFPGWLTRESGENVGKYKILVGDMKFSGNFAPQTLKEEYFTITAKDISDSDVSVDAIDDVKYTGKALTPTPVVRYNGSALAADTDFTVSYSNNKKVGTATVTITGKGNFTGSRQATFKIVPKPTSLSKLTPALGQITVNWKKGSGINGYQIAYSLKSDFSKQVKKTVKGATNKSLVLNGLKSKKTYYVRIRTYKTVKGKKYYSAWSKTKKAKTK